jgi:RNA polymerase sigma-70 factor (ECF subfamily)
MNGEKTVATDEDSGLVARFLRGDMSAFDALFSKYQEYVYNIIYGVVGNAEEARDLTQEVFLQVYRSLPKFRHGARFATWLYRIAVNRAVDAARGAKRWRFLPFLSEPTLKERPADDRDEPETAFERQMEREAVQKILMQCPVSHRDVLALRYYRNLSLEEIAEVLDCSLAAAKVRLHRARKVFKDHYVAVYGWNAGTSAEPEEADAPQPSH